MANDVLMPKMGYDMTEGRILRWLKQEGEPVERGQALAEIETDKATIEIEAFATGTLGQIIGKEGDTVPVGQRIAVILGEGESAPAAPANGAAAKPEAKAEAKTEAKSESAAQGESAQPQPVIPNEGQRTVAGAEAVASQEAAPADSGDRIKASPIARRIAQEHEIDLRQVAASGPGGRIVREDVEAFLRDRQAQPAASLPPPLQPPHPRPPRPRPPRLPHPQAKASRCRSPGCARPSRAP
ncbi:MAG: biotin/lipoyl-containing protein [Thermomicrobiales bacterium]